MTLRRDGTIRSGPGTQNLGVLWYAARPYGDFSLRLQFRDDSPIAGTRANSGVQVRFPAPRPPVPGCPMTFDGNEQPQPRGLDRRQLRPRGPDQRSPDAPGNDPRKTGSIYGFADLTAAQARVTPAGVWNDLEIRVVGRRYTVFRNRVRVNDYENRPGVPFPGRPNDPDSSSRGDVSFRNIRILDLSDAD